MDWAAVSAICAAAAIVGGVFLWVVRLVVSATVETKIALLEQRLSSTEAKLKELEAYSHAVLHERVNSLSGALLDAFKAGQQAK